MANNILEIKNLEFSFRTYGGVVKSARGRFSGLWGRAAAEKA